MGKNDYIDIQLKKMIINHQKIMMELNDVLRKFFLFFGIL